MKVKPNCYKNVFAAIFVIFFLSKCIGDVVAVDVSAPVMEGAAGVFSEEYLAASREGKLSPDQFLSHSWVRDYVKDLFARFQIISLLDPASRKVFFDQLKIEEEPFTSVQSGFETWSKADESYKSFSEIIHPYTLRVKASLSEFLPNLERVIANAVHQENHLKTIIKPSLQKTLAPSFLNIRRTLLPLRNDMEIASLWLKEDSPEFEGTKALILPHIGRIFFVIKKGDVREISYTASGTIINIKGRKVILTCRHFGTIENDADLEIYFIPHRELNPKDFLPNDRMEAGADKINWDSYAEYKVTRLLLHNGPEMKSAVIFKDATRHEFDENSDIVLDANGIQNLKELKDAPDNNDIAFMETVNPESLGEGAEIDIAMGAGTNMDDPRVWAAGYPGGGLSGQSFALVNSTQSPLYNEIINKKDTKLSHPHWHYKISNFPVTYGMSGGAVFFSDGSALRVIAVLQGVDMESCGAICALFTHEDLEIIK